MPHSFPHGPRDGFFGLRFARQLRDHLFDTYFQMHKDYGDVVFVQIGPAKVFFFFHPEDIREVLVMQARHLPRDPRPLRVFEQWNGQSLLIAEGEQWLRQRRLVQTSFRASRFPEYAGKMCHAIEQLSEQLRKQAATSGTADVEVDEVMTALTLDVICQTMFSSDLKGHVAEIRQAVSTLAEIAYHEMQAPFIFPRWLPTRWNRRKAAAIRVLDSIITNLVQQRRAEGIDRGDLLSMLLSAVDEEGDGGSLTDTQVRNECMTLFLGGHDTTAAALDWLWWLLAKHPEVADQCRAEIRRVCHGNPTVYSDLPQLHYVNAVIRESLRLYPPTTGVFLRKAAQDVLIRNTHVPKGALIALSSLVTQRDPRWFPDPERFDPRRFLEPNNSEIPPNAWFPFGAGPRVCIGQHFALMEMALIVGRLLPCFSVSLVPGHSEPIPRMTAALRPRDPLHLRFQPI